MTILTLAVSLPPAPASLLKAKTRAVGSLTAPRTLPLDLASPRFFSRSDPTDETAIAALFGARTVDEFPAESDADDADDADLEYLLTLDPVAWKQQDHYRVLGLADKRYRATPDEIKAAHRARVLKHHPDKLAAQLGGKDNDAVFKCIQKAWDTLSDPAKRRQFDSVDKGVDDRIPLESALRALYAESPTKFYAEVQRVCDREARFAPNPAKAAPFGDADSPRRVVDTFYDYWYSFGAKSWRSFEYEDKDDVDASSNRDHKRYMENKNKAERTRKKTEDNMRIRIFIDRALAVDPRLKKFKEDEKLAKKAKQQQQKGGRPGSAPSPAPAAAAAATAKSTPAATAAKAARPGTAAAAAATKQPAPTAATPSAESAAKLAEAQDLLAKQAERDRKALVKKEKKTIKTLITKDFTYLSATPPTSQQMESTLVALESLLETCKDDATELGDIRAKLESAAPSGLAAVKAVFDAEVARHAREAADAALKHQNAALRAANATSAKTGARPWSAKELHALVSGVNKIPGGTQQRWEKIADHVAHHSGEPLRKVADVIAQSKQLLVPGGGASTAAALKSLQDQQKRAAGEIKDAPTLRDEYAMHG
ncbi:Zuotin [Blastocladiella emersonii ATCC 22665]|nr:Zuotin [Blastocladiella emersonii ATCC 22665]